MVLGNYARPRGWDPAALTEWFHANFVDGYDWVMVPNVVGMSQHADGGLMATKPYAGGGSRATRGWPVRSRARPRSMTCARWSRRKGPRQPAARVTGRSARCRRAGPGSIRR
jgi:hypothetical protein